jgi:D-ribitol-5-phosphate cytidylyltransferase
MRTPIVYHHPGELPPHHEEGTFGYATMAFGEICEDERRPVDPLSTTCAGLREGPAGEAVVAINIAVIFAGGSGQRMRPNAVPKQFLDFHGKPLIIHTLEHFEHHREIDAIAVACLADWIDTLRELLERFDVTKVRWIVEGGETGQMSIYNALVAVEGDVDGDAIVLVHDGVRPIIDADLISRNIASVKKCGTAVTAYPTVETSIVSLGGETVDEVLERSKLYTAQAPQSFHLRELIACHREAQAAGRTDYIDSCSIYRVSHPTVHLVEGSRSNMKVTTPEDYYVFRALSEFNTIREIEGL